MCSVELNAQRQGAAKMFLVLRGGISAYQRSAELGLYTSRKITESASPRTSQSGAVKVQSHADKVYGVRVVDMG